MTNRDQIREEELEGQSRQGDFGVPEENKEFIKSIGGRFEEEPELVDADEKPMQIAALKYNGTVEPIVKDQKTLELIKRTIARDATNDELKLFIYTANKHGLDPLARQIHFVKRGGTATIQTGIDGYRAIAERTGQLAGISDATFDAETEVHPTKATVTVKRLMPNGGIAEFTATARWSEYAVEGKSGFMWGKMPYLMLAKCAEALALRKAFPHDLSGIYTKEEMDQANKEEQK